MLVSIVYQVVLASAKFGPGEIAGIFMAFANTHGSDISENLVSFGIFTSRNDYINRTTDGEDSTWFNNSAGRDDMEV